MTKRTIHVFLVVLMILSTIGTAEARNQKKKKAKSATTIDQTFTAETSETEPATNVERDRKQADVEPPTVVPKPGPIPAGPPIERQLTRASSRRFDLRSLPRTRPPQQERAELPEPAFHPVTVEGIVEPPSPSAPVGPPTPAVQAPPPLNVFEGLDRFNWGAGSPPDPNGDVGPNDYIETVNTSIGVFRKSDGFQEAAFTFNTFMSQGNFGNLCDTNNFGDPVVLYDSFEDRWIISDFAFLTDVNGNVVAPSYQCFAVSMSGDPVSGGWNFYSIQINDGLNDYPKFGIWPDGLYMSSNMFTFGAGSTFMNARVWAFDKAQMYAGSPTVKVVTFNVPGGDFTAIPSNARLQTGTPPPGRPDLFVSTELFLNALTVYKFHVDWDHLALSTFTGPDTPLAATSWPNQSVANAAQPGTTTILDVLQIRAMVQNQYTNFGGTESLWVPHTVRRATGGLAAPRWYQVDVTGGTVAGTLPQATTWDPDAANVTNRFMPSVALDRAGDMAMGYSVSNGTTDFPSMRYAGRLAGDPINTFSKTEQTFFTGTASQTGVTNPPSTTRWGDYSALTLDPDGCTFWLTNEYANPADQSFDHRWLTKFGNFRYPECTPVGAGGTVSGTVTDTPGGNPLSGALVTLGSRSTSTDGSGNYAFNVPAGTYPTMNAAKPGFGPASAASIVITDGNTTTQNFSLPAAPASSCLTDTTQADFQTGVPTNTDINVSPGDVELLNADHLDQQNTTLGNNGVGITITTWGGQTFTPALTGNLTKADVNLFCSGCTGTIPNLTLSIQATSGGLPTGADLAAATITGFSSGSAVFYTAVFSPPLAVTAGTQYALVIRPTANPSPGTYALTRSGTATLGADVYAGGTRVSGASSGTSWSIPLTGGVSTDAGFRIYINTGFATSGDFVSAPKDSNPGGGITAIWQTLSWNAMAPANTSVQFQIAGSNNVNGPFNFVGPDNTAGTFFTTSPVQLSPQFYNFRYLEYKAILTTTDIAVTPALNDATLCFNDVDCSGTQATITPSASSVCANSTSNTASGPNGMTSYAWGIANGTITSATDTQNITYTAGASGTVTLSLTVTAPNGCIVSGSAPVTINPIPATPVITPGGPTTFTYPGSVTLNSSSATGNQWYVDTGSGPNLIAGETNQSYVATTAGSYTVIVTDGNGCVSAASAAIVVVVNKATPTVTAVGGTFVYNGTPQAGTGSATGGAGETLTFTLAYTGTGSTTYGPSATAPTLVGTYSVVAHTDGDANNNAGDSAPAALTITKADPTVIATGGTFTYDGNPHAGSGSATGGGGESLTISSVTYNGTGSTTYGPSATAPSLAGTYTITVHTDGDANNNAGDSAATPLTINKFNPLMAAFGGTFTYNASPEVGTGQAIGGAGEHLPVTVTYQGISGTVWGPTATPPTNVGVYLVTAHTVGDANNNAEDSLPNALRINKATATIVVTGYCAPFDGAAHTATGSATGVVSESLPGLVLSGTTHTSAGTYLGDAWTFSDPNYNGANGTVDDSIVDATITAPGSATTGSTGNVASVINAGAGATYNWGITNGTITAGTGTNSITFTAGAIGTLTVNVTVTTTTGCSDSKSLNVAVASSIPAVTVTAVTPSSGSTLGGDNVTVSGSGFAAGAGVTFGGTAATNVVVVNASTITATTPAHPIGGVDVVVTNTDTGTGTLTNGFTYNAQRFDPNDDATVDPADIFYLVNYLFLGGPPPAGPAGLMSGDANGDSVVDPADIFFAVNYLFDGGPRPLWLPAAPQSIRQSVAGAVTLGEPVVRDGRTFVPVIVSAAADSSPAQALSLRVRTAGDLRIVSVQRTAAAAPRFEITRSLSDGAAYLLSANEPLTGVVAEIEIENPAATATLTLDPTLTMLTDRTGSDKATVSNGRLKLEGTTIGHDRAPKERDGQQ